VAKYSQAEMNDFFAALREGATLKAAAASAGISLSGVRERIDRDTGFRDRITTARGSAQREVENALFRGATSQDKQGRYDVRAQELWLTNADPENWRRKRDDTPTDEVDAKVRKRANELSEDARADAKQDAAASILGNDSPTAEDAPNKDEPVH